jgi:hypothetical protein
MARTFSAISRVTLLASAVGASFLLGGCGVGGQVKAGMGRYEVGNYHEAADVCSEMRADESSMNDKAHVRYLVYCGLTEYRLGNRTEAGRMLARGSGEYSRGGSNWLKPIIVDEMLKALDDLNGRAAMVEPARADSQIWAITAGEL